MSLVAEAIAGINDGKAGEIELRSAGTPKPEPTPTTTPVEGQTKEPQPNPDIKESVTASNTQPTGEPSKEPQVEPPKVSDEIFFSRLSELTGGKVKSQPDFEGFLKGRDELQAQVEKGLETKFPNERAKWAYELIQQNEGQEVQAAMRTLRALSFSPEGKEAKDVLFEAFLLDPKNSDLTPTKAAEIFNASYDKKYGDMEGDLLKQREHELSVRDAKEAIQKLQNDFKATDERPAQAAKAKEVEESVISAVKGLNGGLKIEFSDKPTENDILNIPTDNPQLLKDLQEQVLNPDQTYNELVSQFNTENGFDYKGLVKEMYERANHKQIRQMAFEQGKKIGRLEKINEARNASNPKGLAALASSGGAGKAKNFEEAWSGAVK